MAELATIDTSPPIRVPSNSKLFDPSLFYDDICPSSGVLPSEIDLDFNFDGINWDLSVDDFLFAEDANPSVYPSHTSDGGSPLEFGSINMVSPESGHSANCSTESGAEVNGCGTKRKNEREEGCYYSSTIPKFSESFRSEDLNSYVFKAANEEEEKKKARQMKNRASAQLSRQRKKEYVEELEEKVRSMNSTIIELNSRISSIMAENLSLKQQIVGNGSGRFQPGVYPPPSISSFHFPWTPYPAVVFRQGGSQVPSVPIPKLKSQQAAASQTIKKTAKNKGERKIRKVASITLLGFLFFVLIFGCLIRGVDHRYGGSREFGAATIKDSLLGNPNGMVLSVSGHTRNLTTSVGVEFNNEKNSKGEACKSFQNGKLGFTDQSWPSDDFIVTQNSSESLPALLYVPRNGKHIEINGNLVISSVLASEKAVAQAKSRNECKQPTENNGVEKGLVIANLDSGMALSTGHIDGRIKSYDSSVEHRRALASDYKDAYMDNAQDGPLQQWFREGLTGPIFSSGICKEVFQFHISPPSSGSTGIISSSMVKPTETAISTSNISKASKLAHQTDIKNRRFLYSRAIPLPGSTLNHTDHIGKEPEGNGLKSNASGPPMVVSVLVDPREAGDDDGDSTILPDKSLQRIFVVVLLDSVKYVTYSCVLPFKTPSPHFVN